MIMAQMDGIPNAGNWWKGLGHSKATEKWQVMAGVSGGSIETEHR